MEKESEQPAPDPYRWRYILGIVISVISVGFVAYYGLRKTKVVNSIITFLKNIF
jgi:amino acid transporter